MKRENELYKLWQTGVMTTTKLCKRIAELEAQIEKMKCCANCGALEPCECDGCDHYKYWRPRQ